MSETYNTILYEWDAKTLLDAHEALDCVEALEEEAQQKAENSR